MQALKRLKKTILLTLKQKNRYNLAYKKPEITK